tara:strand:+ start:376518 stop:376880 length:363 start_codon:yes stop_codon:yes gene_type:complete
MKKHEQDKLAQKIKSVLDQSVKSIDADTRYQLQMARAKVLQSSQGENYWYQGKTLWAGITSFAGISALVVFLLFNSPEYQLDDVNTRSVVDSLLLETDTGIELYEQYDFYVWLSEQAASS